MQQQLHFVGIGLPGQPARITWRRPDGAVNGYLVVSTERPFPPEMSGEFFAGRMREHFREHALGPEAADYQTEAASAFYTVLYLDDRGRWIEVQQVREVPVAESRALAVEPIEAEQVRSYNRARWSPLPVPTDRGVIEPDYLLSARCDGFVDTVTEVGFRVHYVALAVDKFQHRRPLRLRVGGFQRLEAPAFLNPVGKAKVAALNDRVLDQLEVELRRKSATAEELEPMLRRARDLMGEDPRLVAFEEQAAARFDS